MARLDQIMAGIAVVSTCLAPIARATPEVATGKQDTVPDKHMSLSGPINARFVAAIEQISSRYPTIRILVIDSEGGEIEAAMQLGRLIKERGWDVAVINKCLSACANYVFPAGKRKRVLPNSWVGIHEKTRQFRWADGSMHYVTGNEIEAAMTKVDAASTKAAHQWEADDAASFRSLGLTTAFIQDFTDYISSRKRVLGVEEIHEFPDVPGCPRYRFWALNKKQLEDMGVTGIDEFWFPTNKAEELALYKDKTLPAGSIYIGGAEKLRTFCKGPALNWFQRLLLKREPPP